MHEFSKSVMVLVDPLGRRGVTGKQRLWAHGSNHEVAAAIRAEEVELRFSTPEAKRALERTDEGIGAVRREILIARLAVWS